MIARLLLVLTTLCLVASDLSGAITEIRHLEQFEQKLAELDTTDLVLFDVDYVLFVPDDPILRPVGKTYLKKLIAELKNNQKYSYEDLWGRVLAAMTVSLVDERMPAVVRGLQKRHIPTIAFTACWSGKLGPVDSCADWRIAQLLEMGYNFTANPFAHVRFWRQLDDSHTQHPLMFKSGVLFSPHHPKGETLKEFFKDVAWTPRRIVFIDDREDFVESVEKAANELGIEFHGFHYTAVLHQPCAFDARVAETQMSHLLQHGEWLSDSFITNNSQSSMIK